MIVFIRMNDGTALYQVAGSDAAPMGAERALRTAHGIHGGNCFYCKEPVPVAALTIDHAAPRARGGGRNLQNLLVSCRPCNQRKGANPIEVHNPEAGREWLSAVVKQMLERLNRL
ncbi:MAG TPA: HNH endonuclease [Allosphingosinicella sp.]|jgi:5-methylcytosine-specific restriction endonuclease McrA